MRGHAGPLRQLPRRPGLAVVVQALTVLAICLSPACWPGAAGAATPPATAAETGAFATDQMSLFAALAPPANSAPPTISGTAQEGMTLTASPGSWTESPTSYRYKWRRCDAQGAHCKAIKGTTSTAYTAQGTDVGHTLRVSVIARNAAGRSLSLIHI